MSRALYSFLPLPCSEAREATAAPVARCALPLPFEECTAESCKQAGGRAGLQANEGLFVEPPSIPCALRRPLVWERGLPQDRR